MYLESKFGDIEEYTKYWLPLLRMDAVYNAVKDNSNSTILQNVTVVFDETGRMSFFYLFRCRLFLNIRRIKADVR